MSPFGKDLLVEESLSLTMLVCPRTSLLRAYERLDILGVVGKELDVHMSPDTGTRYLSNLSYLEASFHQPADTPQGSGG